MTESSSIGKRIAFYRKFLGFNTAQELATAIPNEKVTTSVIQNIEAGRKSDISVAQLLDISRALAISPIFLLTDVGQPYNKVDLANVGDAVARMTSHQVDQWIRGDEKPRSDRAETLAALRRRVSELILEVGEYRRMMSEPRDTEVLFANPDEEPIDVHDWALMGLTDSIMTNVEWLRGFNVDLTWAQDVIRDLEGYFSKDG